MTQIELPYATVSFDASIVIFKYRPNALIGLKEMKETIALAEKLSWSRPYFTLSDVRGGITMSTEAKWYLADLNHLPFFRGAAAIVKNSTMSYAINFLEFFQKKKYPMKAFTSEKKAVEWLRTLPMDDEVGWNLM